MKQVHVRFEPEPSLDRIEIVIRAPEEDEQVDAIRSRLAGFAPDTVLAFDQNEIQHMIPVGDIVSAAVNGKLVNIVTEGGSYYTRQPLRNMESILCSRRFVRISRYEIVNLAKVVNFDFTLSGTLRLELVGGMETWASRRCIPLIRKRLLGKE